ncbi:unnamed protein product [Bursaphelenchus okinawaensis]|uniref:Uncharacterized protein n=1 Tax=Bursaphelenchus okinawaensis TaxID=465554 RepID=A0A811JW10_9BILA|nr:unnamed protein product [Bursaphelenchus okinawaensis]CAG9086340.1 unnamed protein product [Bursaphelenchus okinawaensis]
MSSNERRPKASKHIKSTPQMRDMWAANKEKQRQVKERMMSPANSADERVDSKAEPVPRPSAETVEPVPGPSKPRKLRNPRREAVRESREVVELVKPQRSFVTKPAEQRGRSRAPSQDRRRSRAPSGHRRHGRGPLGQNESAEQAEDKAETPTNAQLPPAQSSVTAPSQPPSAPGHSHWPFSERFI